MSEIELVIAAKDELGEGPLWHPAEQALYWVDIEGRLYHRYQPGTGEHEVVRVGMRIGALAFRASGGLLLAAESGFAFFDPASGSLTMLANPEENKPNTRFNDGAVDRAGRFWAGTLGDPRANHLYRFDPARAVTCMENGVDISNGIGWSPDNRVMYYVDSTPGRIYAYDFDLGGGVISNRRILVDRSALPGVPDGLTVDAHGFLWVAVWGGSCLERYTPSGKLERRIDLPVEFPTSVTFGGPAMTDLYITSAQVEIPIAERARFPLAGNLFRLRNAGQGLPEPFFAG